MLPGTTDADSDDPLTYSLGGTDAGSFNLDVAIRQLKIKIGVTYCSLRHKARLVIGELALELVECRHVRLLSPEYRVPGITCQVYNREDQ